MNLCIIFWYNTDAIPHKSTPSTDTEMAATGSEGAGPSSRVPDSPNITDKAVDSRAPDSPDTTDESDTANDLGCVPLDGLITESMLDEEKELNRKSKEDEKRLQKEVCDVEDRFDIASLTCRWAIPSKHELDTE